MKRRKRTVTPEQRALSKRVDAAWKRLESQSSAARLRPGLAVDAIRDGFEVAFDNHFPPEDFWFSLARHDGESTGRGPTLCPGLRLLSLDEIAQFEMNLPPPVNPFQAEYSAEETLRARKPGLKKYPAVYKAAAAEVKLAGKATRKRSTDARIQRIGPALSLTLAFGEEGRRLVLDLDPVEADFKKTPTPAQIIEYLPNGKIRWVAASVVEWLESLAE